MHITELRRVPVQPPIDEHAYFAEILCVFPFSVADLTMSARLDEDVLLVIDEEVEELRRTPVEEMEKAELHLLLGDSMAMRLGRRMGVCPPHILLERPRSGNTWQKLAGSLGSDVDCWREAAAAFGCQLGTAVIWLSGNDLYPKTGVAPPLEELEAVVTRTVHALSQVATSVMVLGPLPRYKFDAGMAYVDCPAYQHERQLVRILRDMEGVDFIVLGRSLTKTFGGWRIVGRDSLLLFAEDGTHLSATGEDKILSRLPAWLQWSEE